MYRQTQVFGPSQTPGSPTPTQYATAPSPLSPRRPPQISRRNNPDPNFPSEDLIGLVEDQLKDKFNEVYDLIVRANQLARTQADLKYWSPELMTIQQSIAGFVPTMGGRRKSRRRRSRHGRSRR
jgi:hypothetical protein